MSTLRSKRTRGDYDRSSSRGSATRRIGEVHLRRAAVNSEVPQDAPPIVLDVLRAPGQPLDTRTRAFFEPRFGYDFSGVRVHADGQAARSAAAVNAHAFTVGRGIVFGAARYAPETGTGRALIAHELAHVTRNGTSPVAAPSHLTISPADDPHEREAATIAESLALDSAAEPEPGIPASTGLSTTDANVLRRDIAEEQLGSTPVEQILRDPTYFENGLTTIRYYTGELAILQYSDGSEIRLGLVPELVEAPFEGVDFRTPRSAHAVIGVGSGTTLGTGSVRFLPRAAEIRAGPGVTFGQVLQAAGRTIRFTHHSTGRIVPTEVNTITAPRLCEALRQVESEYVRRTNEGAQEMVEALRVFEWIVILYSVFAGFLGGGARGAAGRGGAAVTGEAATGLIGRAQARLATLLQGLLRSGAAGEVTAEGVALGGVRASVRGGELIVRYSHILRTTGAPGSGRLVHTALEQAAVQTARQSGATSARVAVEVVQNPAWRAFLESQGYTFEVLAGEGTSLFSTAWTKVFIL